MDKLTRISLIICLTGLIALFFITQSKMLKLEGINNATEENLEKDIRIKGELKNINIFNESVSMNIKTECYVNAYYYDKNRKFSKLNKSKLINKNISVEGTVNKNFYPDINIKSFKVS